MSWAAGCSKAMRRLSSWTKRNTFECNTSVLAIQQKDQVFPEFKVHPFDFIAKYRQQEHGEVSSREQQIPLLALVPYLARSKVLGSLLLSPSEASHY